MLEVLSVDFRMCENIFESQEFKKLMTYKLFFSMWWWEN